MRAAIELLEHALEHVVAGDEKDRRIAVLHLAQVVELGAKAALVSQNEPVYNKHGRTVAVHEALDRVEVIRKDRLPARARVELLIDERNAIQHRYGALDQETLYYHVESVLMLFGAIMEEFFDTDLHQFIRDTFDQNVWSAIPYVRTETKEQIEAAEQEVAVNPRTAFVDAFSLFESVVKDAVPVVGGVDAPLSSLDVVMKFLGHWGGPDCGHLMIVTPSVYRMRNSVIHGSRTVERDEATDAVATVRTLVDLLGDSANRPALELAIQESYAAWQARRASHPGRFPQPERDGDAQGDDNDHTKGDNERDC